MTSDDSGNLGSVFRIILHKDCMNSRCSESFLMTPEII